jgi:PAS domain S-box-containing protein
MRWATAMNPNRHSSEAPIRTDSATRISIVVCSAGILSYLAARLGGYLVIRPEMIWPLWPGCAFIVAILLLTRRKVWPLILLAGLAGFAVYDLQERLPIRATVFLLLADSIEILVAALGVSYVFGRTPRLNSVKALAKYSLFAVVLAPIAVASAAALALDGDSWWIGFFTEALALLTVTPAILGWADLAVRGAQKPKADYVEALVVCIGLVTLAYFAFGASRTDIGPVLLYALVPFLLWTAFRFGITGTSSSIVVIAFLAILSVVRGKGPFTGSTPQNNVLSLQLFLLVAGASFMTVAALIEERRASDDSIRESEKRFRLVADHAPVLIWMSGTDKLCTYFNKPWLDFTGRSLQQELGNGWAEGVHRDDFQKCLDTYTGSFESRQDFQMEYRLRRHDGEYRWIFDVGVPRYSSDGSFAGYIGSCIDVTERKQSEQILQETNQALETQTAELQSREELLKIFVKDVPAGVAMLDRDMRYLQVSERWCADYGIDASQVLGRSHYDLLCDMPQYWKEVHRRALAGETLREDEERWERDSGTTWVRWEVLPWMTASGAVGGILILAENITQRKKMEEEVVDVSRKLIQSQEQERARIGRELHDDINQRLALLAVELDQLQDDPSKIDIRVHALQEHASELSNDIQALSHELHSSKLDYLGVVTGIRSWCKEFGERQGMEIDFKGDVSSTVPSEIGVTLFRILQEALHNAVKHSGVRRVEVHLDEQAEEIHLDVRDAGMGFDIEMAKQGRGVGLASMDERVKLVKGTVTIDSQPAHGTRIHVCVPLKSNRSYRRAAS